MFCPPGAGSDAVLAKRQKDEDTEGPIDAPTWSIGTGRPRPGNAPNEHEGPAPDED
jgi:hypothetical protein